MPATKKSHDELSMVMADDLISIDHYRVGLRPPPRKTSRAIDLIDPVQSIKYLTIGEVDPHCDDLISDDVAKYKSPEEAEDARDKFNNVNNVLGIPTDAVVVGVNSAGVVMAVDGQSVTLPDEEDGSDIPF